MNAGHCGESACILAPEWSQMLLSVCEVTVAHNSLHAMRMYIGARVTEVNCEADRFLERQWILFPAIFRSGCGLHT